MTRTVAGALVVGVLVAGACSSRATKFDRATWLAWTDDYDGTRIQMIPDIETKFKDAGVETVRANLGEPDRIESRPLTWCTSQAACESWIYRVGYADVFKFDISALHVVVQGDRVVHIYTWKW